MLGRCGAKAERSVARLRRPAIAHPPCDNKKIPFKQERFFAALIDRKRPIRRPYVSERPRELGVQPKTLATLRQVQYPIRQREA